MFYIRKCVNSFLSQSYVTQCVVVFRTIYVQVSGFYIKVTYLKHSVPLHNQLQIELHNLKRSVPLRIELHNIEKKSCLHFYENTSY